jgi:hypothetical protein
MIAVEATITLKENGGYCQMENCGSDLELIAQTVQNYFEGMYFGDVAKLRQAFHPDACLFSYNEGQYRHVPAEEWFKIIPSRPVPANNGEPYDMCIVSTDVTGTVAIVKVADLYQGKRFTDFLTLLKVGESWVIVNKAFYFDQ